MILSFLKDSQDFKPLAVLKYLQSSLNFPLGSLNIINPRFFTLNGKPYQLTVGKLNQGSWVFDVEPEFPSLALFMSEDFTELLGYAFLQPSDHPFLLISPSGGLTFPGSGPTLIDPSRVKTSSKTILYGTGLYQLAIAPLDSHSLKLYPGSHTPLSLYRAFEREVQELTQWTWPIYGYAKAPEQAGLLLFSSAWPGSKTVGYSAIRSFIIRG
jgi:hypothetical protein